MVGLGVLAVGAVVMLVARKPVRAAG
jgi:hypothetical protein